MAAPAAMWIDGADILTDGPSQDDVRRKRLGAFLNEDQDPVAVEKAIEFVSPLCTAGEEIAFVAVQKKPMPSLVTISVVLTNKRLIVHHHQMMGSKFEDYHWLNVSDAHVKEGMLGATFSAAIMGGGSLEVNYLPKSQAKRLYQFAQSKEEQAWAHRRQRDLEDKRAAAGGVFIGGMPQIPPPGQPSPTQGEDALVRLQKLKAMLDAGLITTQEYDAKKAQLLASL